MENQHKNYITPEDILNWHNNGMVTEKSKGLYAQRFYTSEEIIYMEEVWINGHSDTIREITKIKERSNNNES